MADRLWIALPVACMYCHVSVSYASTDERELTGVKPLEPSAASPKIKEREHDAEER